MSSSLTRSAEARDSVDIMALLFEGAFNRSPDDAGLDYWVTELESAANTTVGVAASIIASSEFTSLHAGQDFATIVGSFYLNVLGRAADQSGLDYYLNSGNSLAEILASIALSTESLARNDAALHGYESAVSADALGDGVQTPPLESFASGSPGTGPSALTVQTHLPLDPQFLNENGALYQGDGTTPADGFSTVVDSNNSGLLFGVQMFPRNSDTDLGGTTSGYTPLSSSFDGVTLHVVYNLPSGTQVTGNGSAVDDPTKGAIVMNLVIGLDEAFDFASFLAAGNRITLAGDADNSAAINLVTFEAVIDTANGGTLDFVLPPTQQGFVDFLGTDDTASDGIPLGPIASLIPGAQFDEIATAYNSAGEITQQLHVTVLLGASPYSPADQLV